MRFSSILGFCSLAHSSALAEHVYTRRSFVAKASLLSGAMLVGESVNAYDRDVGGTDMSSTTAAMNIQAKETNARLEQGGFKLDTKEEEQSRLSSALASFSYDASSAPKGTQTLGGKGYSNKSNAAKK